jgi:uncharacterized protein YbaA (DUF1428 family)
MSHYIDGFVLPVPRVQLKLYREIAEKVAMIWKEYGALDYSEYVIDDDSNLEGTRSFADAANAKGDEVVVFGLVVFESREARYIANKNVPTDPRMSSLVEPLTKASRPIFDAERMIYGGFHSLVQSSNMDAV